MVYRRVANGNKNRHNRFSERKQIHSPTGTSTYRTRVEQQQYIIDDRPTAHLKRYFEISKPYQTCQDVEAPDGGLLILTTSEKLRQKKV